MVILVKYTVDNTKPAPQIKRPTLISNKSAERKTTIPPMERHNKPVATISLSLSQRPNKPLGKARKTPGNIKIPISAPISVFEKPMSFDN